MHQPGDKKGCNTARIGYPEEGRITHRHLQTAGYKTRYHHTKRHKRGTNSIVRRLVRTIREMHHIHHIRRKTETVAELLKADG